MNALVIMTKYPEAGKVKTRMIPKLGAENVAKLQEAFITDLLRKLKGKYQIILAVNGDYPEEWNPGVEKIIKQPPGKLDEKICNVLKQITWEYEKVVLIGSDVPQLDQRTIQTAFSFINKETIVIGPTNDGGFYLIGMMHGYENILLDIPMSQGKDLEIIKKRMEDHEINLIELEELIDIDEIEDLKKVKLDPSQNPASAKIIDTLKF